MKRASSAADIVVVLWFIAIFACLIGGPGIAGIFPAVRVLFAL